ncbi:MAG: 16S rRNA (guanine(527)-N(7))-methyltransferase RsmG [Anaerolineae bacterium]|nr:16S rRNA (guanine(527)-N(7))-methyltransferase RsmG [Anaerolineae bacterium]MCB9102873.1 16S rRNA (guanine(527)-N(7))-methyltransferase RsmG [Anaerolineales bacterium]
MIEILQAGATYFNLTLSEDQLGAFVSYQRELAAWNEKFNLTRIVEPREVAVKHFLDSLSLLTVLPELNNPRSIIDVGSGAGFPGIPLKIVRPELSMALLESTGKKTTFLRHVVETLALTNVAVVTARAEEAGRQAVHREHYDLAVARAVSRLAVLAEYTLPLVKVGGWVIAQKGQYPVEEIETGERAVRILGGKIVEVRPVEVPGLAAERHLVILKKIKPTPKLYPRQPGGPAKDPL